MDARSTTRSGGHAALYDAVMWPAERAAVGAWRRRLAVEARGRVLEIAAGTGAQFRWYAPGTEVTALEPDPGMLGRARRRAAGAAARVAAVQGRAEEVPFPDGSFDAAVSAFGLCMVSDPAAALLELRRVLVSGGALLLLEHVHLAGAGADPAAQGGPGMGSRRRRVSTRQGHAELRSRGRLRTGARADARGRLDRRGDAAQRRRVARRTLT